jgi:hypothetical protein
VSISAIDAITKRPRYPEVDALGQLKIAGTFSSAPPVGGATEAKQDAQIALETQIRDGRPFNRIVDEASATVTYVCEATPGTASSAASWRVQRITVAGAVTTIAYAGGGAFNQIANNRASLSY